VNVLRFGLILLCLLLLWCAGGAIASELIDRHCLSERPCRCQSERSCRYTLNSKRVPMNLTETFSDLYLLPALHPTSGFEIRLEFKVIKQLRASEANPWETFWLFWNYNLDGDQLKKTNYIAFKTNGLEIGQAKARDSQEFVWTGPHPQTELGQWNELFFFMAPEALILKFNGKTVNLKGLDLRKLYRTPGRIGLYAEDAEVLVRKYRVNILR
jgi:hypothetical protein